ncbi:transcriptional regulator [Streptomyces rimosus subsp. rimosus]|nr:transcriptional regulator [Streptomyces rimosus subsp. rimosus]
MTRKAGRGNHDSTEHTFQETQVAELAADLKEKYDSGASIRALAEETGRSYGFVHRVLSESGVTLRGRGGATRGKKAVSA